MKIPALRIIALTLFLQHCGSPGTIGDREAISDPPDPKKAGELNPSQPLENPGSVQIKVNDLKTSLLARRSCRPEASPTLARVSFSHSSNIDEFAATPNFANGETTGNNSISAIHYGKDVAGLGIAIISSTASETFLVEIDGLIVGDSLRSENLRTYLVDGSTLMVFENNGWSPADVGKYTIIRHAEVTKVFIHQSLVSEAWNWPAWSVRTSAVTQRGLSIVNRHTGSWITFPSELGGDVSNIVVQECKKNIENGQVITIQVISDKRQDAARVQNTVDLAYTALLQSLPITIGNALPITQFAWVITDRAGGQNPYRQMPERRRMLLDYSDTFFMKLDPHFADDGYFNDSAKEELFFDVVFDLISRVTDLYASVDPRVASLVALAVAEERLETAFGLPAGLYFSRNQSLPPSVENARGGILLSHTVISRVLLQQLERTFRSTDDPLVFVGKFAENLKNVSPSGKGEIIDAVLQGWAMGSTYFQGMGPENLGDTDWDGVPDALENLLGYDWHKSDTVGGGLGDLGRLSATSDSAAISKKASEIVLDGIIDDWKALIPQTLNSDKDETLNSCPLEANINLFGALQSQKNLALSLISKGRDSTKPVAWSIQIDNPKDSSHFLAYVSTGSQEVRLFRAENLNTPVKTWRLNGLIGKDAWELFMPVDFVGIDPMANEAPPLRVRISSHESGKVCDDTPWFTAFLAR